MDVRALGAEDQHRPFTALGEPLEDLEMANAAGAGGIREDRHPVVDGRGDVFHFHEPAVPLEPEIRTHRLIGHVHLGARRPGTRRFRNDSGIRKRLGDQPIGASGVYADAHPTGRFHLLPGVGVLPPGPVAARQPDPHAGLGAAQHRAGIRTVRGDPAAVIKRDIGKKPFIALLEGAAGQRCVIIHAPQSTGRGAAIHPVSRHGRFG